MRNSTFVLVPYCLSAWVRFCINKIATRTEMHKVTVKHMTPENEPLSVISFRQSQENITVTQPLAGGRSTKNNKSFYDTPTFY